MIGQTISQKRETKWSRNRIFFGFASFLFIFFKNSIKPISIQGNDNPKREITLPHQISLKI